MKVTKPDVPIFLNALHNSQFNENGYITIPFLSDTESSNLLSQLSIVDIPYAKNSIYHSNIFDNYDLEILFNTLISNFISPLLYRISLSEKYKIIISVFINKKPSSNSKFDIHTDDSLCDERFFLPINIWIPLVDVDENNGTICIIDGSHKKTLNNRSNTIPEPFIEKNKKKLLQNYSVINIKKGTALIYNPACVHFSPPNKSLSNRPVVATTLIPENADLCIFTKKKGFFQKRKLYKYNLTLEELMKKPDLITLTPSEIIQL